MRYFYIQKYDLFMIYPKKIKIFQNVCLSEKKKKIANDYFYLCLFYASSSIAIYAGSGLDNFFKVPDRIIYFT